MKSAQERRDEAQAKHDAEMNFPGRRELEARRRLAFDAMSKRHMNEQKALFAWFEQSVYALGTDKEGTFVEPVWYYDCPVCADREAELNPTGLQPRSTDNSIWKVYTPNDEIDS